MTLSEDDELRPAEAASWPSPRNLPRSAAQLACRQLVAAFRRREPSLSSECVKKWLFARMGCVRDLRRFDLSDESVRVLQRALDDGAGRISPVAFETFMRANYEPTPLDDVQRERLLRHFRSAFALAGHRFGGDWYLLIAQFDRDARRTITLRDLVAMARRGLKLGADQVSDADLESLLETCRPFSEGRGGVRLGCVAQWLNRNAPFDDASHDDLASFATTVSKATTAGGRRWDGSTRITTFTLVENGRPILSGAADARPLPPSRRALPLRIFKKLPGRKLARRPSTEAGNTLVEARHYVTSRGRFSIEKRPKDGADPRLAEAWRAARASRVQRRTANDGEDELRAAWDAVESLLVGERRAASTILGHLSRNWASLRYRRTLDLSDLRLTAGRLPDGFVALLARLDSYDLSGNRLVERKLLRCVDGKVLVEGPPAQNDVVIPDSLRQLPELVDIEVVPGSSSAKLNLACLTATTLRRLAVPGQRLVGCGGLASLVTDMPTRTLVELNLAGSRCSGTLESITTLTALRMLHLSDCDLEGPVPGELFVALRGLVCLSLHYNRLEGVMPSVDHPCLRDLFLHRNRLHGQLPLASMARWPKLTNAWFHDNSGLLALRCEFEALTKHCTVRVDPESLHSPPKPLVET